MGLKLPFPKWLSNTPITVFYECINQDGDCIEENVFDGECIYTNKSKQIMNAERQLITLSGKVVIEGDICPSKHFEGYILIDNSKKAVYSIEKPLNPDGSVFSTELNLI